MKKSIIVFALLIMVTGCATMADVRKGRGQGTSETFNQPFDKVWEAVPKVFESFKLEVAADNRQAGYFLVDSGMSLASYGEKIAVFVDKIDETHTKVEVVSKRALATNITAPDWEPYILDGLRQTFK